MVAAHHIRLSSRSQVRESRVSLRFWHSALAEMDALCVQNLTISRRAGPR
jgi:hypothetical protein